MQQQRVLSASSAGIARATALRFVILLGVVSLFADMTYEGARSITGPFLALLGASGTVVGLVAGLGELGRLWVAADLGDGLFNTGYGLAWFAGSAAMGFLYDTSLTALIGFSVLTQLYALPLLWLVTRRVGRVK
jgi:hypothetical protein